MTRLSLAAATICGVIPLHAAAQPQTASPDVGEPMTVRRAAVAMYGNLVTYMRIKGVVPPSTERARR
jgi:hypothetical protein